MIYQSVSLKSLHISKFFMILWQSRGGYGIIIVDCIECAVI